MKRLLIWLLTGALIGANIYLVPEAYEAWQIQSRISQQEEISAKVLYPMVVINIQSTKGRGTGSGVVVFSEPVNGIYHTYILTCAHLFGGGGPILYDEIKEIRVRIFREDKDWHDLNGVIIAADVEKDVALLKVETTEKYVTASFPDPDIFNTMYLFEKVYHLGMLFGRDLQPIESHLTRLPSDGQGKTQGPIYPGYSGGPVYLARDLTLIGLNQQIGSYQLSPFSRPVPVPTIAGFISIDLIISWLDEIGHKFIYDKKLNAAVLNTIGLDSKKVEMAPELLSEESKESPKAEEPKESEEPKDPKVIEVIPKSGESMEDALRRSIGEALERAFEGK